MAEDRCQGLASVRERRSPQRFSAVDRYKPGMVEAWIQLRCPSCEQAWQSSPTELPPADASFSCSACGEARTTAQFMKDQRDLEILKEFA
jgi:hypothetical protein